MVLRDEHRDFFALADFKPIVSMHARHHTNPNSIWQTHPKDGLQRIGECMRPQDEQGGRALLQVQASLLQRLPSQAMSDQLYHGMVEHRPDGLFAPCAMLAKHKPEKAK